VPIDQTDTKPEAVPRREIKEIRIGTIEKAAGSASVVRERLRIGLLIATLLLVLIACTIVGVFFYGYLTFPHLDEFAKLSKDPDNSFQYYQETLSAWRTHTKDLLTILVVSLLVPLLASVVGYIFGEGQEKQ